MSNFDSDPLTFDLGLFLAKIAKMEKGERRYSLDFLRYLDSPMVKVFH